jgi:hypothetical protein
VLHYLKPKSDSDSDNDDVTGKQPEKQKSGRPPPSAGTRAAKAAKSGKQGGIRISVSEVTDQGEIVTPDDAMVSMKKRKQPSREGLCFKCKCVLDNERGRTVADSIRCGWSSKTGCPHWACHVCSGFKPEDDMLADKATWFCGCKALPSKRRK